ncbi:hypothetical protein OB955_13355 [Halobacteria archaeon AArc-m2/3/4]|uniref:Preprotein translocase subunit TatA n=1 Tax=Natronoglomus mannanivorans TaxID=2979990 RepID=A0ABT2QFL9_9EURY|nr:hypothetical protein [Halobacteria archaeon AArc-m2/3/4]
MSDAAVIVVFLLLALGAPLALYALIREETSNPRIVDRETAEREARERGGLDLEGECEGEGERRRSRQSDRERRDERANDRDSGWDR